MERWEDEGRFPAASVRLPSGRLWGLGACLGLRFLPLASQRPVWTGASLLPCPTPASLLGPPGRSTESSGMPHERTLKSTLLALDMADGALRPGRDGPGPLQRCSPAGRLPSPPRARPGTPSPVLAGLTAIPAASVQFCGQTFQEAGACLFSFHSLLVLSPSLASPAWAGLSDAPLSLSPCLSPSLQPAGEGLLPSRRLQGQDGCSPTPSASRVPPQVAPSLLPSPAAALGGRSWGAARSRWVPPFLEGHEAPVPPAACSRLTGRDESQAATHRTNRIFFLQLEGEAQS